MTRSDAWRKRPAVMRYWAFKDECRLHNVKLSEGDSVITFVLPMPKSWNALKRQTMNGKPHRQTPDLDNLLKALQDAVMDQDKTIHRVTLSKVWGIKGQIIVE
jgi:Holliday junction resolvase RusA-like endonuclease